MYMTNIATCRTFGNISLSSTRGQFEKWGKVGPLSCPVLYAQMLHQHTVYSQSVGELANTVLEDLGGLHYVLVIFCYNHQQGSKVTVV